MDKLVINFDVINDSTIKVWCVFPDDMVLTNSHTIPDVLRLTPDLVNMVSHDLFMEITENMLRHVLYYKLDRLFNKDIGRNNPVYDDIFSKLWYKREDMLETFFYPQSLKDLSQTINELINNKMRK